MDAVWLDYGHGEFMGVVIKWNILHSTQWGNKIGFDDNFLSHFQNIPD